MNFRKIGGCACAAAMMLMAWTACPQTAKVGPAAAADGARSSVRPKLVVVIVVDQMRADYVDKFRNQWNGGLKRLVDEGAWIIVASTIVPVPMRMPRSSR